MITAAHAYLALAAAVAVALLAVAAKHGPHALHALGLGVLTGLYAYVWWRARRRTAADYHRHGRAGVTHHIRPTRRHRVLVALARLRTVRLTTDTAARAV